MIDLSIPQTKYDQSHNSNFDDHPPPSRTDLLRRFFSTLNISFTLSEKSLLVEGVSKRRKSESSCFVDIFDILFGECDRSCREIFL